MKSAGHTQWNRCSQEGDWKFLWAVEIEQNKFVEVVELDNSMETKLRLRISAILGIMRTKLFTATRKKLSSKYEWLGSEQSIQVILHVHAVVSTISVTNMYSYYFNYMYCTWFVMPLSASRTDCFSFGWEELLLGPWLITRLLAGWFVCLFEPLLLDLTSTQVWLINVQTTIVKWSAKVLNSHDSWQLPVILVYQNISSACSKAYSSIYQVLWNK